MAKNKGLTPKRKKIDRNPRVKNKEKYRRAQIRRKGQVCISHPQIDFSLNQGFVTYFPRFTSVTVHICQVREVRREESKYSGEMSGIRAGVKKSVKLK